MDDTSQEEESGRKGETSPSSEPVSEAPATVLRAAHAMDILVPGFKCLRCGREEFFVLEQFGNEMGLGKDTVFVCAYCGMKEAHASALLIESARKLNKGSSND